MLFWLVAIPNSSNASKASRLAYEVIQQEHQSGAMLGREIHNRLIADGVAVCLPTPADIT